MPRKHHAPVDTAPLSRHDAHPLALDLESGPEMKRDLRNLEHRAMKPEQAFAGLPGFTQRDRFVSGRMTMA